MQRAIVFDLFGTLVNNYETAWCHRTLTQMATELHVSPDLFIHHWTVTSWSARARGVFPTLEESIAAVCWECGTLPPLERCTLASQIWLTATEHVLDVRPEVLKVLLQVRERGYALGIVTDCAFEVALRWPAHPLAKLVDVSVLSCLVGYKKPDPHLYRIACEQLRIVPSQCLYVGDGCGDELRGAKAVGMVPIWLKQEEAGTLRPGSCYEWHPWIGSLEEILAVL